MCEHRVLLRTEHSYKQVATVKNKATVIDILSYLNSYTRRKKI